jgi:TRAP-type uncharacterized transport system fused permease subunit
MYLLFTAVLIFLLYPATKRSPRGRVTWVDLIFIGLSVATIAYFIFAYEAMEERMGYVTAPDLIFGLICILIALETCRRVLGPMLPSLGLLFLLYCYFGPYMPGELQHKGLWVFHHLRGLSAEVKGGGLLHRPGLLPRGPCHRRGGQSLGAFERHGRHGSWKRRGEYRHNGLFHNPAHEAGRL